MSDTYISRCFRCHAPNDAWGSTLCPACRQIDALKEQSDRAAELAEEQSAQYARQAEANARMQEQQHYESMRLAEQNAALARQQAKENARLAAEGGVSYDDAYQYGLHYIETTTIGPFSDVDIELTETGDFRISVLPGEPYKMAHLNQAFKRGLTDSIKDITRPGSEYVEHCAFNAGFSLEDNFVISSVVTMHGYTPTLDRSSDIVRVVETDTGLVTYRWNHPFNSDNLNQAYSDGVNQKINELNENSDENVATRMTTEVADILAERARVEEEQRVAQENARIQQENQAAWNAQVAAEQSKKKSERGIIVAVFLLAVVGLIVGLWMSNHQVFSMLAGFVAVCGLISGGAGALIDYVDGY